MNYLTHTFTQHTGQEQRDWMFCLAPAVLMLFSPYAIQCVVWECVGYKMSAQCNKSGDHMWSLLKQTKTAGLPCAARYILHFVRLQRRLWHKNIRFMFSSLLWMSGTQTTYTWHQCKNTRCTGVKLGVLNQYDKVKKPGMHWQKVLVSIIKCNITYT